MTQLPQACGHGPNIAGGPIFMAVASLARGILPVTHYCLEFVSTKNNNI